MSHGVSFNDDYSSKKISGQARYLVANESTPDFVKAYMFGAEFAHYLRECEPHFANLSGHLLFIIAMSPTQTPDFRRASCARLLYVLFTYILPICILIILEAFFLSSLSIFNMVMDINSL